MNLEQQITHELRHLLNTDATPGVIGQAIKWNTIQRELDIETRLSAIEERIANLEKKHLPSL